MDVRDVQSVAAAVTANGTRVDLVMQQQHDSSQEIERLQGTVQAMSEQMAGLINRLAALESQATPASTKAAKSAS